MNRRTRRRGSIGRLEDSDDPENSEDSENSTEATFLNNIASYSFGGAIGVNEDQQTALQYIHIRTQRLFFRVEVDELVAVVIDRSGYPCGLIQMNARPLNFYAQDIGGMHEFIALSCGRTTDLNTPLSIPCHDWPSDMFRGKVNILQFLFSAFKTFYVVMMLDRETEDTKGVVYRRGLGWILANVWDGLHPERTKLVLG